ncbi:multidrug effflux MFS transporter [Alsobacter sp. R-9]
MKQRLDPNSIGFLALIALFGGLAALGTDMALSAVPEIARHFGVPSGQVGLTLSAFMVGFALSPLVYGPLSDRLGRKPVILAATALYSVAGLACAFAPSFDALIVLRFIQGCGAGASRTLAAAIVRDLFVGPAARSKQSYLTAMQLLAPLSAPAIGALLLLVTGDWRSIFLALAMTGGVSFVLMAFLFAETFKPSDENRLTPRQLATNYWSVFRTPQSRKFLLVQTLMFGCLFSYVSGSPLVAMEVFGLSPELYGASFALTASGIVAGSLINGRLNARGVSPRVPLSVGLVMGMVCTALLVGLTLSDVLTFPLMLALVVLVCLSFGLVGGNAVQLALEPMGRIAGLASSVISSSSLGCGALMGAGVSLLHGGTPLATVAAMALCAWSAAAVYRWS